MKIGDLDLGVKPLFLAPMEDVTDASFRYICKEFGADMVVGNHQHIIQSCDLTDDYLKVYCLGNLMYDNRVMNEGYYYDSPSYNAVLHLDFNKDESGKINIKKSFSIYTTAFSERGLPLAMDSADVFEINYEIYK